MQFFFFFFFFFFFENFVKKKPPFPIGPRRAATLPQQSKREQALVPSYKQIFKKKVYSGAHSRGGYTNTTKFSKKKATSKTQLSPPPSSSSFLSFQHMIYILCTVQCGCFSRYTVKRGGFCYYFQSQLNISAEYLHTPQHQVHPFPHYSGTM